MSASPVTNLRNLLLGRRRRSAIPSPAPVPEAGPGEGRASRVEADVLARAEPSDVMRVFETVPPVLAEPLRLVVMENRSYANVAQLLNVPVETVMSRACSARQLLLRRLVEVAENRPATPSSYATGAPAPGPLNLDMTA